MVKVSATLCDLCGGVMEEPGGSLRYEYRRRGKAVTSREIREVCDDCGYVVAHRIEGAIDRLIREKKEPKKPSS